MADAGASDRNMMKLRVQVQEGRDASFGPFLSLAISRWHLQLAELMCNQLAKQKCLQRPGPHAANWMEEGGFEADTL